MKELLISLKGKYYEYLFIIFPYSEGFNLVLLAYREKARVQQEIEAMTF